MKTPRRPLTVAQATTRAQALCARGEQAACDIRDKLRRWGLESGDVQRVIEQLREQRFLDDRRYAHAYVRDKFNFNGWGRLKLAFMLKVKEIERADIEDALTEIDDEAYEQRLLQLLQSRAREMQGREPRAMRAALMRFAAQRGFEPAVFYACIDRVMTTSDDDGSDADDNVYPTFDPTGENSD